MHRVAVDEPGVDGHVVGDEARHDAPDRDAVAADRVLHVHVRLVALRDNCSAQRLARRTAHHPRPGVERHHQRHERTLDGDVPSDSW